LATCLITVDNIINSQKITFENGCFGCTEAIFETLKGVKILASGCMGGYTENPIIKLIAMRIPGMPGSYKLNMMPM